MTRLLRLALGLIVAFVLTGRVEAATQHCARLAHEISAASEAAKPCHMMGMVMSAPTKAPADHAASMAACECIAFAKGVSTLAPVLVSSRIAALAWALPRAESLVSLNPAPEGPPPKG